MFVTLSLSIVTHKRLFLSLHLLSAVSYLPMPVVAGYLAYIGYFCLQAGVALCISKAMTTVMDWQYVLTDADNALLAAPGLIAGLLLTYLSRTATNDAILPGAMVAIPIVFYVIIWWTGIGLEGAREGGWVGEINPPVPVSDLFQLVTVSAIRWDLINEIMFTWVGMVFVVSFASCLDVAAISMDMGEALDTNKELSTVGICNIMSGLTFGFTGSYIFSQTIFTYRTQVHTRWIGICIMMVFAYVVSSPINILQVAPLFFLGSTLIFIGYDLVYEWLVEIRHKVFLSEYAIVWATFLAIQVVGMDAGIILGVLVAIVDHVVSTAKTTTVHRVNKKSRAVWTPDEYKLLQAQGYNSQGPKIITLEIVGNVFFGSSLLVLERLTDELGLDLQQDSPSTVDSNHIRSPHPSSVLTLERRPSSMPSKARKPTVIRRTPKFVVLDLTQLSNLDASASRGCFLQVVKMCTKRGITVCAAGASPRIDWMLRSHEVAYETSEEERIQGLFQCRPDPASPPRSERILLFLTVHEALEFCENSLIHQMSPHHTGPFGGFYMLDKEEETYSLASVFKRILGCTGEDERILQRLDGRRYHDRVELRVGQELYGVNAHADSFYTVLKGAVAVAMDANDQRRGQHVYKHRQVISGAGKVPRRSSSSNLLDSSLTDEAAEGPVVVASLWPAGSVFGHVDFLLERPRNFRTVATQEGTVVAKISISQLHLLQSEEPALDALLQRVLLQASILDLANCTCDE
jgi:SulP family sulfate permease